VKADEIMHVLRLTAMGRVNHPDQQRLCEALEKLLATPEERADAEMAEAGIPKRGRKAKAD
jgi:hypothetical protein